MLHLYCPWLGFYFIYSLTNKSVIAIIAIITYIFNYIKLQFSIKIKILKIYKESSLINNNKFDKFKRNKDIIIKVLILNIYK